MPQEDAWVTREVLGCQLDIYLPAPGRCFCNSKEMLGCPRKVFGCAEDMFGCSQGGDFVPWGNALGAVSMPGGDAWVVHRDACVLQETPTWLPEIVGCSREVLECPGQVLGCPGDMPGCPSKLLVQHGEGRCLFVPRM